ncbi:hypothetical protein VNI00_011344 [Paramarasmius palmivorus]|uniref:DAGKc domain-containing protein n=1 Tax=Paramarasmius palmivorus TaxID=297713 RepID=A0AAW0CAD0_9AGAR
MTTIAIYNPACGDRTAKAFFEQHVIPLLQQSNHPISNFISTEREGHAGELVKESLESIEGQITVVLGSGDGTLHEIINFLSSTEVKGVRTGKPFSELHFVLVPCGTANALYSSLFPPPNPEAINEVKYRLQSVQAFIDGKRVVPLTLAISTLSSPPSLKIPPKATISAVVTSTCLHAAILKDSEKLRAEMPGIERFKVAAEQNRLNWCNAHAKLLPAANVGYVELYDPSTKSFIPHPEGDEIVDVYGPFIYFLSTVNVDRLEPAFRITPLAKDITPEEATCDLVIIRPLRDPALNWDSPESREAFAPKLYQVMGDAYRNGVHVDLLYNEKGEIVTDGDGPPVVEYIRCGGWEWIPDDIDETSHVLCSDGLISTIEQAGRVVCTAATPSQDAGFMIYA